MWFPFGGIDVRRGDRVDCISKKYCLQRLSILHPFGDTHLMLQEHKDGEMVSV